MPTHNFTCEHMCEKQICFSHTLFHVLFPLGNLLRLHHRLYCMSALGGKIVMWFATALMFCNKGRALLTGDLVKVEGSIDLFQPRLRVGWYDLNLKRCLHRTNTSDRPRQLTLSNGPPHIKDRITALMLCSYTAMSLIHQNTYSHDY